MSGVFGNAGSKSRSNPTARNTMRHSALLATVFIAAFTIFASSALGLPQLAAAASWAALFALFYDRLGGSTRAPTNG